MREHSIDKQNKNSFSRFAEGKIAAVMLAFGALLSTEQAQAQDVKHDAQTETASDKNIERIEKQTPERTVKYVQKINPEVVSVGGTKGKETASVILVTNEGDPKVKGDEVTIKKGFYRFETTTGETQWQDQQEVTGDTTSIQKSFGRVSGFPESLAQESNLNMARTRVNVELQNFAIQFEVLQGLNTVGKSNSPEAKKLQQTLQEKVNGFQQKHPDITIPSETLKILFPAQ